MKIVSTNLAKPKTISWNGKNITTGIYKKPSVTPIFLDYDRVHNDEVSDKKVHGGTFKACYLFSKTHYTYWKKLYPNLDWDWGMFGENLTVSNLDETKIYVGDIFKIGKAIVQVTQPREPCFKHGIKFESTDAIKQFISYGYSGTYVRVIEPGFVNNGDSVKLIKRQKDSLTTYELFKLIFEKTKNKKHLQLAINNKALPEAKRNKFKNNLKYN